MSSARFGRGWCNRLDDGEHRWLRERLRTLEAQQKLNQRVVKEQRTKVFGEFTESAVVQRFCDGE